MSMFRVRSIQVDHGDSLLVSYTSDGHVRHLLVDGGPANPSKTLQKVLNKVLGEEGVNGRLRLEALVVTHYDLDHIEGVIELLQQKPSWLEIGDVWFNGYEHLQPADKLGPAQGDKLSRLIRSLGLPWNASFPNDRAGGEGGAIHQGVLPVTLPGGLEVRVLSPDEPGLKALARVWTNPQSPPPDEGVVHGDSLGPNDRWPLNDYRDYRIGGFTADGSTPNRSSIALLLTFDNKRVLLAADALASVVTSGLKMHLPDIRPIDLLKVSHHGSKRNTDRDLLDRINCRRFLISTSGAKHKHPDFDLIALLLSRNNCPDIIFNYGKGHWPGEWRNKPPSWRFNAVFPRSNDLFVDIEL
ncbi:hypothetical protein OH705_10605 [Pseudomonas sp. BJa3]|nr:hypothetical protein [Pseudomonas sp. BJa3]MCX5508317.1 hypothetical protein [Pseudomonas sp. BJa3]